MLHVNQKDYLHASSASAGFRVCGRLNFVTTGYLLCVHGSVKVWITYTEVVLLVNNKSTVKPRKMFFVDNDSRYFS